MRHELKTSPQYFKATWAGAKTFEIRKNDRNFEVHDEVVLMELADDSDLAGYTGREIEGFITYVTDFEQKPDYVVFCISEQGRRE